MMSNVLLILLPLTLAGMFLIGFAFVWAVRSNQFDDVDGPAYMILYDEEIAPNDDEQTSKKADMQSVSADDLESGTDTIKTSSKENDENR
ncbi:cbb3-type cytochrome oxidase assembly protein CcoS [Ignatzschineria sp. RMDPL8A]|uniref:cbb3-type cytochrome oxidase assembly protein CcoS n=1 Tax=Ignatzschineria sp. RMDPL8A TaxID=2999236 RepID=UPI00244668CE|nr:cbb3-type cytochrome oxidase assembly protein CcoS [Ignatzschineria sp. RMDPL8A]MDG9730478.1 cbb3-type cytochrome oxidase assembly protein CcoS [Ignatzschineria sp. RMDPL8A]